MSIQPVNVGPTVPHHTYLGGSDIGAVLGLSPYKTQLDVWSRKTGRVQGVDNMRTRAGQRFERVILECFQDDHPCELTFPGTLRDGVTGATPDAIIDGKRNLQVKFVGLEASRAWGSPALGEDGIPAEVLAQVHFEWWHIRKVLGVSSPVINVLAQIGTEQRLYDIIADEAFAEDMLEAGRKFWRDHIVADRVPAVREGDGDTLRALYRRAGSKLLPITTEIDALAREYKRHQRDEAAAGKAKSAIGVQLMDAIRENLGFAGPGIKVTWREQKGRVDWQAAARELGADDDYGDAHRGEPIRILDVRVKGDE